MNTFFRTIVNLYSWTLPARLVQVLRSRKYHATGLLAWFWQMDAKQVSPAASGDTDQPLVWLLWAAAVAQIVSGIWLLVDWARFGTPGAWEFGVATLLAYPLVLAHLLAFGVGMARLGFYLTHPKKAGRALVCLVLERQVVQLRKRHHFKLIAVAGSIGKTSTKRAIAELLAQTKRVRYETGNYNDRVTVPLIFFGAREPSLFHIFAWFRIFAANQAALGKPYPFDVVVVELGTDGPNQMGAFSYLKPDIMVITAVSAEHMAYFGNLDAVAKEELTVFAYSKKVLVNGDDIAGKYLIGRTFKEYSVTAPEAAYYAKPGTTTLIGQKLAMTLAGESISLQTPYLGVQGAKATVAAAAVAAMLAVQPKAIAVGVTHLTSAQGRMQLLSGIKQSTLIDDTYNASPIAVNAALDVLYGLKTTQRIAILGSMNELGDYSPAAHQEVGAHCDPKKLDLIITIGSDAERYLAPVARKLGCTVKTCTTPYQAGAYALEYLKAKSIVLAKGSQNGVFAEEALKLLLADAKDTNKLVRQSAWWLARKHDQFPHKP